MGLYERYIVPKIIDWSMRNKRLSDERRRFVPLASGRVLEIGIGSGLNLPFYSSRVERLFGLEPSTQMRRMASRRIEDAPFPVDFLGLSGEDIPAENETFDTVLSTWTLCTIPDVGRALKEMRRVLKPHGRFIFVEHGRAPERTVALWQDRLNGIWKRLGGGCNLNRRIDALIAEAGFEIAEIDKGYIRGPKPMTFLYRGIARRA